MYTDIDSKTDTTSLDFPPEYHHAAEVLRENGDTKKTEEAVKKMGKSREQREIVMLARKDARKLTLKEIADGKIA